MSQTNTPRTIIGGRDEDDMGQKLLQINFKVTTTTADYAKMVAPLADPIAKVHGLVWKVWIYNEQQHEAGGIYLFKDEASANDYLGGDIVAGMKAQTTLKDITVKVSDIDEGLSRKTRGPIAIPVAV